jgi:hypothetical protein
MSEGDGPPEWTYELLVVCILIVIAGVVTIALIRATGNADLLYLP